MQDFFNKNGFAKALFRGSFPSSSQACCCADAWEEMVRPWTVWKKTIQILLEWQMTGCWHFLLNLCVVWLSQVAQGPSVPPPPSVPEARWLRGPTSFWGQLVLPLLPFIQKPYSSHSSHIWAWMDSIWDCAKYCPHKQFARLRSDGRFRVLQPRNRLHSNPPFWGRIPVVWPLLVQSSISPPAKCSLTFFFEMNPKLLDLVNFCIGISIYRISTHSLSLSRSIYLSIFLSFFLSFYLFLYLSLCLHQHHSIDVWYAPLYLKPRRYFDTCIYIYMYICIYVYMYICIYVYMYICIYVSVYMYICIYVYMYICIYVYMYICIYVYMYICIYVYMYICIYVYMYICIYVYMYICIYVYMYMYVYIYLPFELIWTKPRETERLYLAHMHISYVYIYIYVYMHIHIFVHMFHIYHINMLFTCSWS